MARSSCPWKNQPSSSQTAASPAPSSPRPIVALQSRITSHAWLRQTTLCRRGNFSSVFLTHRSAACVSVSVLSFTWPKSTSGVSRRHRKFSVEPTLSSSMAHLKHSMVSVSWLLSVGFAPEELEFGYGVARVKLQGFAQEFHPPGPVLAQRPPSCSDVSWWPFTPVSSLISLPAKADVNRSNPSVPCSCLQPCCTPLSPSHLTGTEPNRRERQPRASPLSLCGLSLGLRVNENLGTLQGACWDLRATVCPPSPAPCPGLSSGTDKPEDPFRVIFSMYELPSVRHWGLSHLGASQILQMYLHVDLDT